MLGASLVMPKKPFVSFSIAGISCGMRRHWRSSMCFSLVNSVFDLKSSKGSKLFCLVADTWSSANLLSTDGIITLITNTIKR